MSPRTDDRLLQGIARWDAVLYWELGRVPFNLALCVAALFGHIVGIPFLLQPARPDQSPAWANLVEAGIDVSAANALYSAVYLVEHFVGPTESHSVWRRFGRAGLLFGFTVVMVVLAIHVGSADFGNSLH